MTLNCVVFNKNEIYWPISFIGKLSSDYGLFSKTKFDLEDLYLDIKQTRFLDELYCEMTRLVTLKLFKFFHFCSSLSENLVCL